MATRATTAFAGDLPSPAWAGLAHARRKFDEAIKAQGKGAAGKTGRAQQGLAHIQCLYRLERDIRDLSAAERHQRRQDQARPLMDRLREWLDKSLPQVPPQSAIGKALAYLPEWAVGFHRALPG